MFIKGNKLINCGKKARFYLVFYCQNKHLLQLCVCNKMKRFVEYLWKICIKWQWLTIDDRLTRTKQFKKIGHKTTIEQTSF